LRDVVARAYTPEQLEKILKRLSPAEAARLLASIEPRAREDAPQSTFRLAIVGLREGDTCPRCGWQYGDALPDDPGSPPPPVPGNGEPMREAARRAQKPFPSEPPAVRKADTPPDPPGVRLLDPDGNAINLDPVPAPPIGPYGPHEIP
jgi:hypothetical protein